MVSRASRYLMPSKEKAEVVLLLVFIEEPAKRHDLKT